MDFNAIHAIIHAEMSEYTVRPGAEIGAKYHHGQRVAKQALALRKLELPDDATHDDIILIAGWFHDVRNGRPDHAKAGAVRTRELLEGTDYLTPAELDEVCAIIAVHDDRYGGRDTYSPWIKLQQDADLLDHFGTFDIWCHFAWCKDNGIGINEAIKHLSEERPKEFGQYLNELNYESSRLIYREKMRFFTDFVNRFVIEGSGEFFALA